MITKKIQETKSIDKDSIQFMKQRNFNQNEYEEREGFSSKTKSHFAKTKNKK